MRVEADGSPFAVHVEEPHEREPRLEDERGKPARGRLPGAVLQRSGAVGNQSEEEGQDDEVGQLPRRAVLCRSPLAPDRAA